jgi:hypothetical protein
MSPCSPSDVSVNIPDGPSGPAIPGFGKPFSLNIGDFSLPDGFPEDLLKILDLLNLLVPPGALKSPLNPNFGKDIFDGIMKLLDQFMPFLMLYKFFLPILNIIICIIEVLCSLMNPFKLVRKLKRLFRVCIPEFLNLFPIFALIIMIISLLLLILALIEFIIQQIIIFIKKILRNIIALNKALERADGTSILAIAQKLGAMLCIFQNFFVLFAIFNIIIQIIRDILALIFSIPPCDDGDPSDEDGCCTPDVCPAIVKTNYDRNTGGLQYLRKYGFDTGVTFPGFGSQTYDLRQESWQFYDGYQAEKEKFINIINAFDVLITPKPVFFPTDSVYLNTTAPKQAPYLIDLRFFYYPPAFPGRIDSSQPRYIKFLNCIMQFAPTDQISIFDNSTITIPNGVVKLVGGGGFEDDGVTPLFGFDDGIHQNSLPGAGIEGFIHLAPKYSTNPTLIDDQIFIGNIEYTFKPNIAVLMGKQLVTAGCVPDFALDRQFMNNIVFPEISAKTEALKGVINGPNFPDPDATQQGMATAISSLRSNLTVKGVAEFEKTCNLLLQDLKDKTNAALGDMVGVGVDPCKSILSASPTTQFTSKSIVVKVDLNENNGHPITTGLTETVAKDIASRLSPHITFGNIDHFIYDGYQSFTANLTSPLPGAGSVLVSFDNTILCANILPSDLTLSPSHILQEIVYQFIYTPIGSTIPMPPTGEGDSTGTEPRRGDEGATDDGGRDNI